MCVCPCRAPAARAPSSQKKKDEEARLAAKKAREAAERAAFNRIASTNDGQLRIEAARRLRKPIKGDPKYDEFVDTDDEEEEAVVDKKPKASEEADGVRAPCPQVVSTVWTCTCILVVALMSFSCMRFFP